MTTRLAWHAVIQITLIAYSVLISGAGMRFARIVERRPNSFIHWLHDYGLLLLLVPAAWFFASLREARHREAHEENYQAGISYLATAGSIALVACAFAVSVTVVISRDIARPPKEQKTDHNPRTTRGLIL
jgi:heme/copper-type cytochrome/quinol oxidase subunit 2